MRDHCAPVGQGTILAVQTAVNLATGGCNGDPLIAWRLDRHGARSTRVGLDDRSRPPPPQHCPRHHPDDGAPVEQRERERGEGDEGASHLLGLTPYRTHPPTVSLCTPIQSASVHNRSPHAIHCRMRATSRIPGPTPAARAMSSTMRRWWALAAAIVAAREAAARARASGVLARGNRAFTAAMS